MLNMDFSQQVIINTHQQDWQPSPKEGVWRKPLAREDKERGHATSIVRYDPGAHFSEIQKAVAINPSAKKAVLSL